MGIQTLQICALHINLMYYLHLQQHYLNKAETMGTTILCHHCHPASQQTPGCVDIQLVHRIDTEILPLMPVKTTMTILKHISKATPSLLFCLDGYLGTYKHMDRWTHQFHLPSSNFMFHVRLSNCFYVIPIRHCKYLHYLHLIFSGRDTT